MAIDFFNRYPQNSGAKTTEYPFGSFRDETAPDAKDGTTLQQDWSNDWQAFFGKLLVEASMTPNGTVDTVVMSQYYDALLNLIRKERTKVSDILNGTQVDVASSENALRRAYENAVASVKKAGDTMTGNLVMQASTQYRDISIPQNNVGSQFNVKNESGQMVVRRGRADGNVAGEQRIEMPHRSGKVALIDDGFGFNQRWYDVTGERISGYNYVNTTSKAIMVSVWMNQANIFMDKVFTVYVDNVLVARADSGNQNDPSVTVIIPAGSSYSVHITGVTLGVEVRWVELR